MSTTMRRSGLALVLTLLTPMAMAQAPSSSAPAASAIPMAASAPGSGYESAAAVPRRAAREDVDPVMRQGQIDQLATIRQRGSLRACVVPVPPIVQRTAKGEWEGFSIELALRLSSDIGVRLEIVPSNWVDVISDLLHRQCDAVITGLWRTSQRALVVNFTQPTATEGVYLMGLRHAGRVRPYPQGYDRTDVRIGRLDDPLQRQVLKERFPHAQEVVLDDARLLAELAADRIDAALVTTLAPDAILQTNVAQLHLPSRLPLAKTSAAIAIRKGDADFLNFLDTWLAIQHETGWMDERAMRWSQPAH